MSINPKYIDELKKFLPDPNDLDNFLHHCQIPLKKSLKINLHKIGLEKFFEITGKRGWTLTDPEFEEGEFKDIFYIDREDLKTPLGRTFLHQSGFFYIQEIAAGMPARFVDIKENSLILDISAAPGGKSVQIADYLLAKYPTKPGLVISNDVSSSRNSALAHNISRMGVYNTAIAGFNGFAFGKNLGEVFDSVLVDAPCSGEGTGFKSDSSLKFWKLEEIKKIAGTQFQLLVSAIKSTKPGGSVVYSTCTLNPYENEINLKRVIEFFGNSVELEDVYIFNKSCGISKYDEEEILSSSQTSKIARFWPHIQKTGGFFISKLRKKDTIGKINIPKENKLAPRNQFRLNISESLQKKILEYLLQYFGMDLNSKDYLFVNIKDQIYITSPKFAEIKTLMEFERIGIPIIKTYENGEFQPLHGLGTILGKFAKKNFVELDEISAQKYSLLNDIDLSEIKDGKFGEKGGYIILKRDGYGIGIGKIIGNSIKNKYIK